MPVLPVIRASVVVVVRNEVRTVARCLRAILEQTCRELELIVVDNGSTDGTGEIVRDIGHYAALKVLWDPDAIGIAALRNLGVALASGTHVFFTDGDCVPERHWVEEGLQLLASGNWVGVEGKTVYEAPEKVTVRDCVVQQLAPGEYRTCNVAYPRSVLDEVGGFDQRFTFEAEDRDLALRVLAKGPIAFCEEMVVFHQQKKLDVRTLFARCRRVESRVRLFRKHGSAAGLHGRVFSPRSLLLLAFPPLIFLTSAFAGPHDVAFAFAKYASLIYERLLIWKAAIREEVFVL